MPDPLKLPIIIQRDATLVPRVIRILHPGYYPTENTLLHLHAVDDGGIDFDTVMAMCSILTGNTTIGFLSARKRGPGPRTTTASIAPLTASSEIASTRSSSPTETPPAGSVRTP